MTTFYNKNTSTYLKNLFQKHDILNLIHKDNSLYIQNERNYIVFKRVKKLGPDVLNFDQIENRNLQYNINQMETLNYKLLLNYVLLELTNVTWRC